MKKILFTLLAAVIVSTPAVAQRLKESQVPAATRSAFEKKYPGVKGSWDKEGENYEVNFRQNNAPKSAVIDARGNIIETETDIAVKDLPAAVKDYLAKHYRGSKISEAARIEKANGEINYEAEINNKDIIFDANGKFIKEAKD